MEYFSKFYAVWFIRAETYRNQKLKKKKKKLGKRKQINFILSGPRLNVWCPLGTKEREVLMRITDVKTYFVLF